MAFQDTVAMEVLVFWLQGKSWTTQGEESRMQTSAGDYMRLLGVSFGRGIHLWDLEVLEVVADEFALRICLFLAERRNSVLVRRSAVSRGSLSRYFQRHPLLDNSQASLAFQHPLTSQPFSLVRASLCGRACVVLCVRCGEKMTRKSRPSPLVISHMLAQRHAPLRHRRPNASQKVASRPVRMIWRQNQACGIYNQYYVTISRYSE